LHPLADHRELVSLEAGHGASGSGQARDEATADRIDDDDEHDWDRARLPEECCYHVEDTKWSLEVVDFEGTSIVWDDQFDTDDAAKAKFQRSVAEEGLTGIISGSAPIRH
jgi:hypothetical protein